MLRELWYPNLHPPIHQFRLSVLYGDGFASVLPSWSLRESHRAWQDLEILKARGLYEPLRLRTLLADPAVQTALLPHLTALAHEVAMSRSGAPDLQAWSAAVLSGERPSYESADLGRPMTIAPRGAGTESFTLRAPDGSVFDDLREVLVRTFGFVEEGPSGSALRAPREVIDRVVRVAVGHVATQRPDLMPTTELAHLAPPASSGAGDRGALAWFFSLPAPPDNWTLSDVLRVRDQQAEGLERLRQHMTSAPIPDSASELSEMRRHLDAQLRKDLRDLRRALGDDPRRRYAKAVVVVAANIALMEVLGGAAAEWGVAASVGMAVLTDLVVPAARGNLVGSDAKGPTGGFAYSRLRSKVGGWPRSLAPAT